MSSSEPELGLGTVVQAAENRVHLLYPATGEMRMYAAGNAPLKRVQFQTGQEIEDHEGKRRIVASVREEDEVLTYCGDGWELPEAHLSDRMVLQGPEDRLEGRHFDEASVFALRRRALEMTHQWRHSSLCGFLGGRIDLIPHQLHVAREVCSRLAPRVLLSDEVGLGKTIEAGLVIHRQMATGRAARVLILVPESLVHQWFVEMLRKFNLWFNIFDEERCLAIESSAPLAPDADDAEPDNGEEDPDPVESVPNPFLDDQLILCSLDFLASDPERARQAREAGWDLLVVDEAHHLEWSGDSPSQEYELVEAIGREAAGLLLLTATPQQLGLEGHFARLRLLDPDRYPDLASLEADSGRYVEFAPIAQALSEGHPLDDAQKALLNDMPGLDTASMDSQSLLSALLDQHGPGRVLFRNTRRAMSGFPGRFAHIEPLSPDRAPSTWREHADREFSADSGSDEPLERLSLKRDPRIEWLGRLLEQTVDEKVLLICGSLEKALAIERAVSGSIAVKAALFHEDLNLVQRDRNAAWFAEEDGARLLICSEIGSEGRNFQFACHLVLFDLPLNPELLEQRIGRLDRIGQTRTIHIHVPHIQGGPHEVLARWYHEGLDAFERNLQGADALLREFGDEVLELARAFTGSPDQQAALDKLISRSAVRHKRILRDLEDGRDRLLELNSNRPGIAAEMVESIQAMDESPELENFILDILDHYLVHVEDLGQRTYLLDGRGVSTESFPGLPRDGLMGTFDRARALRREDMSLLTSDHPVVNGSVELFLAGDHGNCSFGIWRDEEQKEVCIEAIFVLEVDNRSDSQNFRHHEQAGIFTVGRKTFASCRWFPVVVRRHPCHDGNHSIFEPKRKIKKMVFIEHNPFVFGEQTANHF